MKQYFLIFLALLSFGASSQNKLDFGIKAGLNYNANGDYFESTSSNYQSPDRNIGYHLGIYGKFGNSFYFRPELVYTKTKSDYDAADFSMKKLDAPLLLGIKVLGPLSVFGGPSLQYIIDTDFDGIDINDIESDFTVGINFGVAATFKSFALDLRYERGLSNNEAEFLINNNLANVGRIDTRPDQLILSLSINLL